MKITVEFDFPKELNERIPNDFIFGDVLGAIPFSNVSMKVVNRICPDKISFESIENAVSSFIGYSPLVLQLKTRDPKVVEARQICHYLSWKHDLGSYATIGQRFGNKNHSTVMFSCKKIGDFLETDKLFKKKYETFINSFFNEQAEAV